MLKKSEYIEIHSMFYDFLLNSLFDPDRYISYNYCEFKSEICEGIEWFVFHRNATDYSREILNSVNQFYSQLIRLKSWSLTMKQFDDDKRNNIFIEIVEPLVSFLISDVYAIKGGLAFVVYNLIQYTILLYKWDESLDKNWQKNGFYNSWLPKTIKKYENYTGNVDKSDIFYKMWQQIDDEDFRHLTNNYRGSFHHMIPPGLENHKPMIIKRDVRDNGTTSFGIGPQKSLLIVNIIPGLEEQHKRFVKAFFSFYELLIEMIDLWKIKRPHTADDIIINKEKKN